MTVDQKPWQRPPGEGKPAAHLERPNRRCVFDAGLRVLLFVEGMGDGVKCVWQFPPGLWPQIDPLSLTQVSILDAKRGMNIAIFLKQFKR